MCHSRKGVNGRTTGSKSTVAMHTICVTVLTFPSQLAAITRPSCPHATSRIDVTANSRNITIAAAQMNTGRISANRYKMERSAPNTINLSARGSINLPKLVIRLYFLAIFPSSISVRDVRINKAAARILHKVSFDTAMVTIIKTGTRQMRISVSLLGRLSFIEKLFGAAAPGPEGLYLRHTAVLFTFMRQLIPERTKAVGNIAGQINPENPEEK